VKKYILFAGVNGAGKSTLYQTNESLASMPRINVDEMVRQIGSWKNPVDVMQAGKLAVKKWEEYLEQGISFNQETTLCGRSILQKIQKAKKLGYFIELYYVGLDSAETAKLRVRTRVASGGHGISEADIERRYQESIQQLQIILPICDMVEIYDNTIAFTKIAGFKKGTCIFQNKNLPEWVKGIDLLYQNVTTCEK